MHNVKVLENLLVNLEKSVENLEAIDGCMFDNYGYIKKITKDYHIKNSGVVEEYLIKEGMRDEDGAIIDIALEDVVSIISGQISSIKTAVEMQLDKEYKSLLAMHEMEYGKR